MKVLPAAESADRPSEGAEVALRLVREDTVVGVEAMSCSLTSRWRSRIGDDVAVSKSGIRPAAARRRRAGEQLEDRPRPSTRAEGCHFVVTGAGGSGWSGGRQRAVAPSDRPPRRSAADAE
jgi:hypothetical protein